MTTEKLRQKFQRVEEIFETMCICCCSFFISVNFYFPLFLGKVMYANEKEKQKLTEIKN